MNVKPHKVMSLERSTNNNIESQNIEHVTDCLLPWATRMEQEYNFKVFRTQTNRYTKLNLSALLRGDLKAREAFYKSMLDRGVYNIDEVRAFEEMNPLEDGLGEQRFIPMNMASLEYAKTNGNTGLSKDTTKGTSE
jgi:HK97 family phage portal protein